MTGRLAHERPHIVDIPGHVDVEGLSIPARLDRRRRPNPPDRRRDAAGSEVRQNVAAEELERIEVGKPGQAADERDAGSGDAPRPKLLDIDTIRHDGDARAARDARERRAIAIGYRHVEGDALAPGTLGVFAELRLMTDVGAAPRRAFDGGAAPQQRRFHGPKTGLSLLSDAIRPPLKCRASLCPNREP